MSNLKALGESPSNTVVLYDGYCGFCSRSVSFLLANQIQKSGKEALVFAPLQSETGKFILAKAGLPLSYTDALVVHKPGNSNTLESPTIKAAILSGTTITGARAALALATYLRWPWRALGWLSILPTPVLDAGYKLVARYRYRFFGRRETCFLPSPTQRAQFMDT
jgi:predicted DCC family thiol-disulfide oxidoreductase YuxK